VLDIMAMSKLISTRLLRVLGLGFRV